MNGRSGFAVQVLGFNREFLGFKGELLAPEAGSKVNLPVQKLVPDEVTLDQSGGSVRMSLQNTLGSLRLVKNDGNGKLQMKVSMRPYGAAPIDQFNLSVSRRVVPVIDITPEVQ